jgi:hypothetical protein
MGIKMGLPPKSYFHLTEIAEAWGTSIQDLACYTIDGLLEIAVMTIGVPVETGSFLSTDQGMVRIPAGDKVLQGPYPVISADLWTVFRTGAGRIRRFKPQTPGAYVVLAEGVEALAITVADLIITREERQRFEAEHGLAVMALDKATPDPDACAAAPDLVHRDDYAEVVLNGEIFRLGPLQAAVVRRLHEASRTANPWRPGKELLADCNAQTMRMIDLFKTKPNWRTLIASDGRGYYRLNLPDRPGVRHAHRAYRRLTSLFQRRLPLRSSAASESLSTADS